MKNSIAAVLTNTEIIASPVPHLTYFAVAIDIRLKQLRDDGNVRGMLFKAHHALEKVADYTEQGKEATPCA